MGERWYPALIVIVLLGSMVYALHADLSRHLPPRPPGAPAEEQQKPPANQEHPSGRMAFPVEIVPGPDHTTEAAEQKRHADENAATEKDLTDATWKLAYFTLALAIFAAGQVALFFWQLGLIRESLDDAKMAAEAARDGAAAAQDGANVSRLTMVNRDRAYVHYSGFRYISHPTAPGSKDYFWRLRPIFINAGNTPTRSGALHVDYEITDAPLPDGFVFRYEEANIPATIAPHTSIEGATKDILGHELLLIQKGERFLYAWGTAIYRDVFPGTPLRITRFCVVATDITGNPLTGWHAERNPLEIRFRTYHRHNCADEECADDV